MSEALLPQRFDLVRHLGTGGSAQVYEVIDRESGRRFALKMFRCAAEQIAAVKSEFRAIGELRHPNLVGVGELFQHGDHVSFTMELVDGEDISTWFAAQQRAHPGERSPFERLRRALLGLAEAIGVLHRAHKLHLDIKPSNVLVTAAERVVLIDYGLIGSGGVGDDGRVIGTPAYVAPERLRSREIGAAADWYSMGALMFHVLTGMPLDEDDLADLASGELGASLPRTRLGDVPLGLADLAFALLDPDPTRRPTEAEIFRRLGGARGTDQISTAIPVEVTREVTAQNVERAVAATREAWATQRDATRCVALDGDPGAGKTRSLDAFCAEAAAGGALVVRATTHARERTAFHGLSDLVDALVELLRARPLAAQLELLPANAGDLATVFPAFARLSVIHSLPRSQALETLHASAADALARLLGAIGQRERTVIALHGIQWWDRDALVFLERVLPALAGARLFVVFTRRPGQGRAALVAKIWADSGLALTSVRVARSTPATGMPVHTSEHLTPLAHRLLDVITASVVPLPLAIASGLAELPVREVGPCMRELAVAGLVTASGGDVTLDDHASYTIDRILPEMRVEWRRRIAAALAQAGADPAAITRAYHAAQDREQTVIHALRAAPLAHARGAAELAAELYRFAIEAGADDVATRTAWVAAARDAGLSCAAGEELLVLAELEPARAREHRRLAGLLHLQAGEVERGLELLRATGVKIPRRDGTTLASLALARVFQRKRLRVGRRVSADPTRLAEVDSAWAVAGALALIDTMRGALVQQRCLQLALAAGEPGRAARAIASEAGFRAVNMTGLDEVEPLLAQASELATTAADPHAHAWIRACRGFAALLFGDWQVVIEEMTAADAQLAELPGTHWERAAIGHALVTAQFFSGDLGALAVTARRQVADSRRRGDRFGETGARVAGIIPLLARGDVAAARRQLDEAQQGGPRPKHLQSSLLALQQANVKLMLSDGPGALAVIDRALDELSLLARIPLFRILLHEAAARAALFAARAAEGPERVRLRARIEAELVRLEAEPLAWARALAELHRGGLAQLDGDAALAVRLRTGAAMQLDAIGMPMHAAFARTAAGQPPSWHRARLVPRWKELAALHAP